jgi:hypothetical protein
MLRRMQIRTLLAGIMLAVLAPGCAPQSRPTGSIAPPPAAQAATTPPANPATPPKLVVLVVVDQLPSWWFEKHLARFADSNHGIARLLREGTYYSQATYPYAVTFTAAGHAALGTGAPPAVTGISDNEKWSPTQQREVPAAVDPAHPVFVLTADPVQKAQPGRSSAVLRVDGIADVLERERPGAQTVTISLKDRSAVFVAGHKPDLAIWYDDTQPAMTTSDFYTPEPPAWLRALARGDHVSRHLAWSWEPLAGIDHRAITGTGDKEPGETVFQDGLDNEFPHDLARSKNPAKDLGATPAGDVLLIDTALAAIDAMGLGSDPVTDFLALSFSAHDVVGHYWGPDSWERFDIFARFDQALAGFLGELDRRFGPEGYALVLTSDHGVAPLVEHSRARGHSAHRLLRGQIKQLAQTAATSVLGAGTWIDHVGDNSLYVSPAFQQAARRDAALDAVAAAIRGAPGIQYAQRIDRLGGGCEQRTDLERLACYSIVPEGPGDIYFAASPHSITTRAPAGTNHGSPNLHDRQVPILVRAPGIPRLAGERVVREPVSTLQVAPTLAELLGISAPPAARERPLP